LDKGKAQKMQEIVTTEDSSDSDVPLFNPGRFAFVSKPRQTSIPRPDLPAKQVPSRASSNTSGKSSQRQHTATDGFTDDQIRRLTRCVACNLTWTAKKTVPMKVSHIRVCQKKNALSDETIQVRLSQELSNNPVISTKKTDPEVAPTLPTTLMEEVVKDTGPKKRGKRKEATSTITDIQQRHDAIQARAKSLFGLSSSEDSDEASDLSHPKGDEIRTSRSKTPPLTQNFPVSRLGTKTGFGMHSEERTPLGEQVRAIFNPLYPKLRAHRLACHRYTRP
jgi:hypothetical protein